MRATKLAHIIIDIMADRYGTPFFDKHRLHVWKSVLLDRLTEEILPPQRVTIRGGSGPNTKLEDDCQKKLKAEWDTLIASAIDYAQKKNWIVEKQFEVLAAGAPPFEWDGTTWVLTRAGLKFNAQRTANEAGVHTVFGVSLHDAAIVHTANEDGTENMVSARSAKKKWEARREYKELPYMRALTHKQEMRLYNPEVIERFIYKTLKTERPMPRAEFLRILHGYRRPAKLPDVD